MLEPEVGSEWNLALASVRDFLRVPALPSVLDYSEVNQQHD